MSIDNEEKGKSMEEAPSAPLEERAEPQGWLERLRSPLLPVLGIAFLILAAVVLILYIGVRGLLGRDVGNPGFPLDVTKVSSTPSVSPVPLPSCETIIGSGDVQVAASLPVTLSLQDAAFPVRPVVVEGAAWSYPSDGAGNAVWICGTVVNYVLGLPPDAENRELASELSPGDPITLTLANGTQRLFRFVEQELVVDESNAFSQSRPGLTLLLEEADGALQAVKADYSTTKTPADGGVEGEIVSVGQAAQIGAVEVAVSRGYRDAGDPALSPDTMYYFVDFSVTNTGSTGVDASTFDMQLEDGAGNRYLLSIPASLKTDVGPIAGEIPPGETVRATAGYIVPERMVGPTLTWVFYAGPRVQSRVRVRIPYEPPAPSLDRARVSVVDAFLDEGGGVLIVEGEIENEGSSALTIERGDISFTSNAGTVSLRMAAPPLPWVIDPGDTQVIELQYETPGASPALLTLLGYSFEIGGF